MERERQNDTDCKIGAIIGGLVMAAIVASCSGCIVPAVLGVKTYQSGDTKVEFITGVDFGFGMNGVDAVHNERGISRSGGYDANEPISKTRKY